jgi:hypothetical protein
MTKIVVAAIAVDAVAIAAVDVVGACWNQPSVIPHHWGQNMLMVVHY